MSKLMRLALAAIALAACLPLVGLADGGLVQGQVVNGTAGMPATLSDLLVRLYLFSGNDLKETRRTHTDDQGMFRFEGVPTGSAWSAIAAVEYAGVEYASRALDLATGNDFNGDIVVFETTTDDSALRVERSHLIIELGAGQLEVTEMVILSNSGDRSYVGSEEVVPERLATAKIPLPAGATDVSFAVAEVGAAMIRTGQGFVDTRPIVSGRQDYVLSYALPFEGTTYNLLKPVIYPTNAIDVLVDAPGAEVNAPALERLGTREAEGRSYLHLSGRSLSQGSDVLIRLSGLRRVAASQAGRTGPGAPAAVARPHWWLDVVPLLAMGVLLPLLFVHLRRGSPEPWPLQPRQTAPAIETERGRLLANLAELDERYEAGQLEESTYRREREAQKEELLNLMLSPQGKESEKRGADRRARGRGAGAQPRKEVRTRGRAAERRPKTK